VFTVVFTQAAKAELIDALKIAKYH